MFDQCPFKLSLLVFRCYVSLTVPCVMFLLVVLFIVIFRFPSSDTFNQHVHVSLDVLYMFLVNVPSKNPFSCLLLFLFSCSCFCSFDVFLLMFPFDGP